MQALQAATYNDAIFKQFQQFCGLTGLLPTSHTIARELVQMTEHPVISGAFGDIWEGIYNGERVAMKVLRVFKENDVGEVKRVTQTMSDPP